MKKIKKILLLLIIMMTFEAKALDGDDDATLKNIKINNQEVECIDYVCNAEVTGNKIVISYETNSQTATVNSISGQTITFSGNSYTATRIVTSGDGQHIIEYTFNINKHIKSSDYSLKEIKVNDELLELHENGYSYNHFVDFDVEKVIIKALPTDDAAQVITNSVYEFPIEESSHAIDFVVKAEDGESKTYRVVLMRNDRPDTTLQSLKISEGIIKFEKDVDTYNVNVPYSINIIEIDAVPTSDDAKIEIKKDNTLKVGENTISVNVINKNAITTYTLIVNRSPNMDESLANLKSLVIDEVKRFNFDANTLEYTISLKNIPSKLEIAAKSLSSDGRVTIMGNEDIHDGSVIKIQNVLNETGLTRTYTINVALIKVVKEDKVAIIIALVITVIMVIVMYFIEIKGKKNVVKKIEEIEVI